MYVMADTVCWNTLPLYVLNFVTVGSTIGVESLVLSNSYAKLYGAIW